MGDFYTEQLVKKKTDGKDIAMKILLIVLTVISFFILYKKIWELAFWQKEWCWS